MMTMVYKVIYITKLWCIVPQSYRTSSARQVPSRI